MKPGNIYSLIVPLVELFSLILQLKQVWLLPSHLTTPSAGWTMPQEIKTFSLSSSSCSKTQSIWCGRKGMRGSIARAQGHQTRLSRRFNPSFAADLTRYQGSSETFHQVLLTSVHGSRFFNRTKSLFSFLLFRLKQVCLCVLCKTF